MPWDLQYLPERETALVCVSGHLSDAEARDLTEQTIALLKRTRATRVLGDCRALESGPRLAAIYWLVHDYANLGARKAARIALLQPRMPQASDAVQFYTLACSNQQYGAELFESEEAAQEWLRSTQPA